MTGHVRQIPALTLAGAKAIAEAAERFARERGWTIAIAVVEESGGVVLLHAADGIQPGSRDICLAKARTAARFKRPTKAFEDAVAGGRVALVSMSDAVLLEGGIPIAAAGHVIGAVGVSGMTSAQDGEVAAAGLAAFAP